MSIYIEYYIQQWENQIILKTHNTFTEIDYMLVPKPNLKKFLYIQIKQAMFNGNKLEIICKKVFIKFPYV